MISELQFYPVEVEAEVVSRKLSLETGALAKQADGAVVARYGDTEVLATVVVYKELKKGVDFLPLTVNFEEKLYAAGKIPGGFFKREGKPSEHAILSARIIDRAIRPLFPKGFCNEVQIVNLILSKGIEQPDILGLIASSAALSVSGIPFEGPIGAVRIGYINNQLVVNPTEEELKESKLNLVVAGTGVGVTMMEAGAKEVPEEVFLEALKLAQTHIKEIVALQKSLVTLVNPKPKQFTFFYHNTELESFIHKEFGEEISQAIRILNKKERNEAFDRISLERVKELAQSKGLEKLVTLLESEEGEAHFNSVIKTLKEKELKNFVVKEGKRVDGRAFDEIRPITSSVGLLPRVHGSGLFTRGETQVLTILTLGTVGEVQIVDDLSMEEYKRFIHQYNFLPFSVGEIGPMRGPGRREIGHGNLVEKALEPVIPPEESFPYTIRLVSEVLESNGSSSMASVCASTLALMDGGVPIKAPVAGIAIGLITRDNDFAILADIQGMEDAFGEMDFKVAGTRNGVTALQLDIKIKMLPEGVLEKAFEVARKSREDILDYIQTILPAPRADLSPEAPRVITFKVSPDKIRDIIGPGGKMINKIIAEADVKIDIEDDGRVFISSPNVEAGMKAKKMIEEITRDVKVGDVFKGKILKLAPFGAIVELFPGREGLIHLSRLTSRKELKTEDVVCVGDEIDVKVLEVDYQGKINLDRLEPVRTDSYRRAPSRYDRYRERVDKKDYDRGDRDRRWR